MKLKIKSVASEQELSRKMREAAMQFLNENKDGRVFTFDAPMGAGKTTFIKALCEELGVTRGVASPTFAIVNEYRICNGKPVYHFDFYRVKNLQEAEDFGVEEYFYSGEFCFIEWPEVVVDVLPEETIRVKIEVGDNGDRLIMTE